MSPEDLKKRNFESEFVYSTSRSSGPGGQNVNKVNTKVELRFSLNITSLFSDQEKELILSILRNKINNDGELVIVSQSERSQLMNKMVVTERFYQIISKALSVQKKRRATRPTIASKLKRLENKKIKGFVKKLRKDSDLSGE